jgi:hypothetical protein
MAVSNVGDYVGGRAVTFIEEGFEQYFLVYNDTGGTLTNGDVVVVEFAKDVDTTAGTNLPTVKTPATSSIPVVVGVVNNAKAASATIADTAWGWVQIRGFCPAITKTTATNPVAIDDYLKAMNTVKTAATDGTSGATVFSAKSFAVAKSAVGSGIAGTVSGILLGREVTI